MTNTPISGELPAGPLDGTELTEVVQAGNNRKATTQAIADLAIPDGTTGMGASVLQSAATIISPTLVGTVSGAGTIPNSVLVDDSITIAGHTVPLGGSQALGASDLTNGTTGSGQVVLQTSPTITSPTFSGTVAGSATVPNAVLANSTITIAGHSVSLGGAQNLAASDLTNGTTGTGAVVLASAITLPALGVIPPNAVVMLGVPNTVSGFTDWTVYKPDGTILDTSGSSSQGLQEAVNLAFLASSISSNTQAGLGYSLYVLGCSQQNGGAAILDTSQTIQFPPMQGAHIVISQVTLGANGVPDGDPLIQLDSALMCRFEMPGTQTAINTGPAIKIKPTNPVPQPTPGGVGYGDSSIVGSTIGGGLEFDFSGGGGIYNTLIDFDELNTGNRSYGILVNTLPAGTNFGFNTIRIRHLHAFGSVGVQVGLANPAEGQQFGGNRWEINGMDPDSSGGTYGFVTYASNDSGFIGISGGISTPFQFAAAATGNTFLVPYTEAPLTSSMFTGSNNTLMSNGTTYIDGTPTVSGTGSPTSSFAVKNGYVVHL